MSFGREKDAQRGVEHRRLEQLVVTRRGGGSGEEKPGGRDAGEQQRGAAVRGIGADARGTDEENGSEDLEIYRSTTDRLACTLTREGKTTNCFAALDEDSTLTELQPGDNILSMQADSGAAYLQASVSFYPMEAGILPEPL